MTFKLKTSKKTMEIFSAIEKNLHLQPFALCKIALAFSLKNQNPLEKEDFEFDNDGLELNRQTISGEYDDLFKALTAAYEGRFLSDEEYFPKYMKAHIERGAKILFAEYKYCRGNFFRHLLESDFAL